MLSLASISQSFIGGYSPSASTIPQVMSDYPDLPSARILLALFKYSLYPLIIPPSKYHNIWPHYCMANRMGKGGSSDRFPLLGLQNYCGQRLQPWNRMIASWQESDDKQCVVKQRYYSADNGSYSQGCSPPSGHVWLWEPDTIKRTEFQRTDAFQLWYWRRLLKIPWTARRSN